MRKLIIHAGFGKSGSTAIQRALGQNADLLQQQGIFLFGPDLTIRPGRKGAAPVVALEQARAAERHLADPLMDQMTEDGTYVLSAENLSIATFPPLFTGLDVRLPTTIVFYQRPEVTWLPSAWAQFAVHKGRSLSDFVQDALKSGHPNHLKRIKAWQHHLPAADIKVRILSPEILTGAEDDFFKNILRIETFTKAKKPANASFDYSLLHIMSQMNHIFDGRRVDRIYNEIRKVLPSEFQKTNISFLDFDTQKAIFTRYREDTVTILREFCSEDIQDPEAFYDRNFKPTEPNGPAYTQLSNEDIQARALSILLPLLLSGL